MPTLRQAQQLQEFSEEVFEMSKDVWTLQSKAKDQTEISETEFLALDILSRAEPLSVGKIQKQIGILPAQMSRVIRSLEHKGEQPLIHCRINTEDKRKIDVELTPAGREAHQAYRKTKLGSIERILLALSERDRNEFLRILRLIRDMTRNELKSK